MSVSGVRQLAYLLSPQNGETLRLRANALIAGHGLSLREALSRVSLPAPFSRDGRHSEGQRDRSGGQPVWGQPGEGWREIGLFVDHGVERASSRAA